MRLKKLNTALFPVRYNDKVVSALPPPARDPTPLSLLPFGRLKVLELRGCDLSTSATKGLLELRHTLEKIVCHNSTDALRHVFASRIAEIKGSPQWNRLSFVSCACNGLLLMDESLHLLPAFEMLDLSQNKFAKVDNLRKCVKLKHLDLGFNQLRSISSFSEIDGLLWASTRLLNHVLHLCSKQNILEIYLHVQTNNEDAINFYKKFGFEITETIKNYYTNIDPLDCFVLAKFTTLSQAKK
ncbi:hypothetical protein J1N35_035412 [Gossypium stocksii]|uniref:N-acetyltransferase domain-containing protein n=1 Tax=Gossypium stocksii TaxID=47602 RepID=A0A9D3UTY4_9ROSI|nr:hypothetical protein J1N35_035412 [Gossypium stocksii]